MWVEAALELLLLLEGLEELVLAAGDVVAGDEGLLSCSAAEAAAAAAADWGLCLASCSMGCGRPVMGDSIPDRAVALGVQLTGRVLGAG